MSLTLFPGLPHCRASLTHNQASGIDRSPCVCESVLWRGVKTGFPSCIRYGLRHGPASMSLAIFLSPGLPHCRASLTHEKASGRDRPPCVQLVRVLQWRGVKTGFPVVYDLASGMDRLPCLIQSFYLQASRSVGLPLHTIKPPAKAGFQVHVDPCSGPPALSGFPVVDIWASGIGRLPCLVPCFSGPPAMSGFP